MGAFVYNEYTINTKKLCKMLGISRQTLVRWENLGWFTAPRTMGGYRTFTKTQARHIVKAFQPGGKRTWFFTQTSPDQR